MKITIIQQAENQNDLPSLLNENQFPCNISVITSLSDIKDRFISFTPDVIIADLRYFKILDLKILSLIKENSSAPLAIYLSIADVKTISNAFESGISGFILEDCSGETLVQAVKELSNNHFYMDTRISHILLKELHDKKEIILTPREIDVLDNLKKRMTNKEISEKMGLSENTIKSHIKNIFRKKGINKRSELMDSPRLGYSELT